MPRARAPGRVAGYLEEGGEERGRGDEAGHGRGQRPAGRRRGERRRGDEDDGAAGRRRRERRGRRRGVGGRGGDEDDGAASRRRGSSVERGEGKGIEGEGEGERGDRFRPGIGEGKGIEGEGTILMAHHPSVRHKYIHTNGAPHPGAPLVFFFFDFCSSQQVIFHLT